MPALKIEELVILPLKAWAHFWHHGLIILRRRYVTYILGDIQLQTLRENLVAKFWTRRTQRVLILSSEP